MYLPTNKKVRNNHLINNLFYSTLALVCAFSIWHILSVSTKVYASIPVAVVFYNSEHAIITAPEYIYLELYAKRSTIKKMLHTTVIHIDAANYAPGTHTINKSLLMEKLLSIPEDVVMIHCSNLVITVDPLPQENVQCTDHFSAQMASELPLENLL